MTWLHVSLSEYLLQCNPQMCEKCRTWTIQSKNTETDQRGCMAPTKRPLRCNLHFVSRSQRHGRFQSGTHTHTRAPLYCFYFSYLNYSALTSTQNRAFLPSFKLAVVDNDRDCVRAVTHVAYVGEVHLHVLPRERKSPGHHLPACTVHFAVVVAIK